MEVGSSGGPDKNRVYGLSNTTGENMRSARSVSTVGSSKSVSSTQSEDIMALKQYMANLTKKYEQLSVNYEQLHHLLHMRDGW
jgi:hypothetical protein